MTTRTPSRPSAAGTPGSPLRRWARVVEAFAGTSEWGIRDLAAHTGIPRSAVHRIVHDMEAVGLLSPTSERGRFRVGPALARVAVLIAGHLDVRSLGRPILERAAAAIGETVVLTIYDPTRRQFSALDAVETNHAIRYIWEALRDWHDLHLGSSGKGILAFLADDEQDAVLAALPEPVPGGRPRTKAALRAELAAARELGYVISHGERYEGAVGVSAPYRDARGRVAGCLIATWPDNRTNPTKEEAVGRQIRTAADELSRRLGWTPSAV